MDACSHNGLNQICSREQAVCRSGMALLIMPELVLLGPAYGPLAVRKTGQTGETAMSSFQLLRGSANTMTTTEKLPAKTHANPPAKLYAKLQADLPLP
jgi:hypothetical protein